MLYELISGRHSRMENGRRVRLTAGARFVPSAAELRSFGDRLRPVPEQPQEPEAKVQGQNQGQDQGQDQGPVHVGGGYYQLPDGTRIKGKSEAEATWQAANRAAGE